jgi:hypothetical protein
LTTPVVFFCRAFELELIIVTQLANNHRAELCGKLLASRDLCDNLTLQSFDHAHELAGRAKLADGQVAVITMHRVDLCSSNFFCSDPRHARISWSELEEHRRSFSVLKSVRTVTLRTPTLVGLFSVLLWGYIVHRKGLLLAFYPLVFVVAKEICGCAFRWAIDAFNTRGIRTAATTQLGGLTQACFELLLLLQLEAVAMMAPLMTLNLLPSEKAFQILGEAL